MQTGRNRVEFPSGKEALPAQSLPDLCPAQSSTAASTFLIDADIKI